MKRLYPLALFLATAVAADDPARAGLRRAPTIQLRGRPVVTVTGPEVRLGDVADITSAVLDDEDAVIALKKILLRESPAPGTEQSVAATEVLERMRLAGVQVEAIGYALPQSMKVRRAGRILRRQEVEEAIEAALGTLGKDIELRSITYKEDVFVPSANITVSAKPFRSTAGAQVGFSVEVQSPAAEPQRFPVYATIDEWAEVPVAARPVTRGSVLSADDVVMARMNIRAIPRDSARSPRDIIGLEIGTDVGYGEMFRRGKLVVPPIINPGARVTLLYREGPLEASASGVAIEAGAYGDVIRVRNESSKRVVSGTVLEPGVVGVKQ